MSRHPVSVSLSVRDSAMMPLPPGPGVSETCDARKQPMPVLRDGLGGLFFCLEEIPRTFSNQHKRRFRVASMIEKLLKPSVVLLSKMPFDRQGAQGRWWVDPFLTLPLTCCVTLGKLLCISGLQLSHLQNGRLDCTISKCTSQL